MTAEKTKAQSKTESEGLEESEKKPKPEESKKSKDSEKTEESTKSKDPKKSKDSEKPEKKASKKKEGKKSKDSETPETLEKEDKVPKKSEEKKPKLNLKLFKKYDFSEVSSVDLSLSDYINLDPCIVPHSHGRHSKHRFWKRKVNIVERLLNKLMVTGHQKGGKKHVWSTKQLTGKKIKLLNVLEESFDIIAKKTDQNPIQILVDASTNSAPRAEITTVQYGGVRHPIAVDVAPQRRVDLALSFLTKGAANKASKNKITLSESLANELIKASKNDTESFAIEKKNNLERQAEASK